MGKSILLFVISSLAYSLVAELVADSHPLFQFNFDGARSLRVPRQESGNAKPSSQNPAMAGSKDAPYFMPMTNDIPKLSVNDKVCCQFC